MADETKKNGGAKVPADLDPSDPALKALIDDAVSKALAAHVAATNEKLAAISEDHKAATATAVSEAVEKTRAATNDEVARRVAEQLASRNAGSTVHPDVIKAMANARENPKSSMAMLVRGEATRLMMFPHDLLVTLADHTRVQFRKGIERVPESMVDHFYLRVNGVKEYKVAEPPAPAPEAKA